VVSFDRFQHVDYEYITNRIKATTAKFNNCSIYVDATGVGRPTVELLQRKGVNVVPYIFTNQSKKDLVNHLSLAIEQKAITYPEINVMLNELESFTYEITKSGNISYGAPSGTFDDCVYGLALAVMGFPVYQWNRQGQPIYPKISLANNNVQNEDWKRKLRRFFGNN